MLLLAGLGNPGPDYAKNRHNIGFLAVEEIARHYGFAPWRSRFSSQTAEGRIGQDKVLAIRPQTFMNHSGRALGEALRYYKLASQQLYVFYDELDLRPGKLRVKQGGGHGGHNGLRSIDAHIGQDYWRVRMGIGHPGDKDKVTGYVLHDFAKADQAWLEKLLPAVAKELPKLLQGDPGSFMSRVAFLTAPPKPPREKRLPVTDEVDETDR